MPKIGQRWKFINDVVIVEIIEEPQSQSSIYKVAKCLVVQSSNVFDPVGQIRESYGFPKDSMENDYWIYLPGQDKPKKNE